MSPIPPIEETRSIIVTYDDGRVRRLVIPAKAKVTLGTVYPGKPGYDAGQRQLYLRVYRTEKEMLLVEPGVAAFFDESLDLSELHGGPQGPEWLPITPTKLLADRTRDMMDRKER